MNKRIFAVMLLSIVAFSLCVKADTDSFSTVAAGKFHSLAVKSDSSLWAWGKNDLGQLGDNTIVDKNTPVKIMDNVSYVTAQDNCSAAIKDDGSLWIWGDYQVSESADGQRTGCIKSPIKISDDVSAVILDEQSILIIKNDRTLWSLGLLTNIDSNVEYAEKLLDDVIFADKNGGNGGAIKSDGSLWAWGDNHYGQLGVDTNKFIDEPIKVTDNVLSVSLGRTYTMAIKKDKSLWGWGNNEYGQLGIEAKKRVDRPTKVMDDVVAVSVFLNSTMAIKKDGGLWAWGSNFYGQLGDGSYRDKPSPVKITDNVLSVSSGNSHTLAIKNDGTLWVWGNNEYGQLGDGTNISNDIPVKQSDVFSKYRSQRHIRKLVYIGLIEGNENGDLMLDKTLTRAEAAVIFAKLAGYAEAKKEIVEIFTDVPTDHWANPYVRYANLHGIIKGVGENKFAPDDELNYDQLIALTIRALRYEPKAQSMGGYPMGYRMIANQEEITTASTPYTEKPTRDLVFKIINNVLSVPLMEENPGFPAPPPNYDKQREDDCVFDRMHFTKIYVNKAIYDPDEKTLQVTYDSSKTNFGLKKYDNSVTETFLCELEYDYKAVENGKLKYIWISNNETAYLPDYGKIVYVN